MADRGDIDRIRGLLQQHQKGLTIEEVAQELDINRSTASKYLNSLVFSGSATIRKLGPAKLFYLREQLPLQHLLNCTYDGLVVLDADLVVQEINANALFFFDVQPDQVKGLDALHTPLRPLFDQETCSSLREIPESGEREIEGSLTLGQDTWAVRKKIIPLQFQSGKPGTGIIFRVTSPGEGLHEGVHAKGGEIDPSYIRACKQSFQLSALFRRFSLNQLSLATDTLKRVEQSANQEMVHQLLQEETMILENLRFHLNLIEEYLDDDIKVPGWYLIEDILTRSLSSQKLAHIRFFSDIRGVEVFTDRDCGRIFSTLLENSIVHGKKVTSIRVTSKEREEALCITYEDDGVGIPEREKATLFEWGHGIHKAHSLFLSRQILAVTDISIRETGTYGRGARFELLVPAGNWREKEAL
ncbi:MAG: helix-turn-helix domain-containing protein [Methanolinea sp.]|jgi:transcriptional regulator with XRE-family HTH domain|nr:helix-turn-helix domain-containing protein [Methanolinea sp.]